MSEKEQFKMVYKDCGHGVHGNISVVERKDGKLIIWKRARSPNYKHQKSFRQEIKKSIRWRQFGVSQVKVCWHPDGISLLKTYIKGLTLKQMLKQGNLRFSKKKSKPVKALGKLVELLVNSRHYIADVNRTNLVFDGEKWHIIDSSIIHGKTSLSTTRKKYKRAFLRSWSKSIDSKNEKRALRSFLEKYS